MTYNILLRIAHQTIQLDTLVLVYRHDREKISAFQTAGNDFSDDLALFKPLLIDSIP